MVQQSVVPDRDNLRKAIRWLSDHGEYTLDLIDRATLQFGLSPQDEQFLIDHFLKSHQHPADHDPRH